MIMRPEQKLETTIWLPPGPLLPAHAREILRLAFDRYAWFKPKKIGEGRDAIPLKEGAAAIDMMMESYVERAGRLLVSGHTYQSQLSFHSNLPHNPSYTGSIMWWAQVRSARKPEWKEVHVEQVAHIMRLVNSPLATAGTVEDHDNKTYRYDPHPEGGTVLRVTARGYHKGLVGLFWRNFFGPPLVRFFGDKLRALPPDRARDLGGIWLVEPYDSPELAGTGEARARERELIQQLGPECFYDQEHDTRATRVIHLPALDGESKRVDRGSASRKKAIQKRLLEYWTWARRRWEEEGAIVRTTRQGYLLLSGGSGPLTKAVLDWGLSHTEDPLFLRRTPDQVARYLEARGEVPRRPIHPDARAELARIRSTLGDEGFDALIGLLPAMRDVEAALKEMAPGSREARGALQRVEVLRKLSELLTFIPKSAR